MTFYRHLGELPRQRHTALRDGQGKLLFEELMGEEGFSSDSSLLYHRDVPAAIVDSVNWDIGDLSTRANHPLRPIHLKPHDLFSANSSTDAVQGRRLLLANADVRISYVLASTASELYRNAVGDECVYVEEGSGVVETVFGSVPYRAGDYVVIPRATTHRWLPSVPSRLYAIEANSHIVPPGRYLSKYGQFLENSPFCERDIHGPQETLVEEGSNVDVLVKHRGHGPGGIVGSRVTHSTHPFDVVAWDGYLYPYTFNVGDYMPITGKIHQPPPVHQVFEGHNFVICNFVPRKVDYHPQSVTVPYYHSNVDSDEVMFYVAGNYEARKGSGIGVGSISLHPGGHAHGPLGGVVEKSIGIEYFDELAVMVDTFAPLEIGEAGQLVDDGVYAWSWAGGRRAQS